MKIWLQRNSIWLFIIGVLVFLLMQKKPVVVNQTPSLKPLISYQDKKGNTHVSVPVTNITSKKEFKKQTSEIKNDIKDKNIKITDVTTVTTKTEITKDSLKGIIKDSVIYFGDTSNYHKLAAKYNLTTNIGSISCITYDTLTYVKYIKKRFLKSDSIKVDIKNTNKENKIETGNSISLVQSKPLLSFGVYGGWNPLTNNATFGIGVMIPIFHIKTKK